MAPQQREVQMLLRNVTPSIPEGGLERAQLEEDLKKMRCVGLLERPWGLKQEEIIWELLATERPNVFDGTIQDRPQQWTSGHWREVCGFLEGGVGLAHRTDTYVDGKFTHTVDPKDGYPVKDCRNARQCRVLEFLVPIVHLDKPTRVTITIGNTIFGALDGRSLVDWGVVFWDLVEQLVAGVGKPKPTPMCPFIFHLYYSQGLLLEDEERITRPQRSWPDTGSHWSRNQGRKVKMRSRVTLWRPHQ